MSEYNVVEIDIKDEDSLKSALKDMGIEFEVHENPIELLAYGSRRKTNLKAHIFVHSSKLKGYRVYNDLGFHRRADGKYEVVSDFIGSKSRDEFMNRLKQEYGKHVSIKKLKRMGFRSVKATKDKNGYVKVKAIQ